MQIGQLNNLIFPDFGGQPAASSAAKEARARGVPPVPETKNASEPVQSASANPTKTPIPADLVYSNARKGAGVEDAEGDAARAAEQHQLAMARSADAPSSLTVGKDGVLVSKPAATNSPSEAFVNFAVNTMRQYAEEQDRQKTLAKDAQGSSSDHLIPRSLGEVQKLASRFKLFA
jgi:hypothetical protein